MEPNDGMQIEIEESEGVRVVRASGELTIDSAGILRDALCPELRPGAQILLDCRGLTRIDLAGLQLLCSAHRTFWRNQACFALREAPAMLLETVRAAGYEAPPSVCPFRQQAGNCLWKG